MVSPCLTIEIQSRVLYWLAKEVISIKRLEETVDDLVANPCRLYAYVIKTPIDWQRIAKEVGADRKKIYHWYRETHSRHILTIKMTDDDREEIREMIVDWIKHQRAPDEQLYKEIYDRFGTRYSRQELRMTYNNMRNSRCVRALLDECDVQRPVRRRKMDKLKNREHVLYPSRATSSSAVPHASDSHPVSLDKEDLPIASPTASSVVSHLSPEPSIVPDDGPTNVVPADIDTPSHYLVPDTMQYAPLFMLLNPQTLAIPQDVNASLVYLPLFIVEPRTNILQSSSIELR